MQTPTPYEQREHQLCFFFIQLNRQVSSVRKKSQCAFYVVICLPAPRANETKVVLFLKKTKSASPFCLLLSAKPHDSPIKIFAPTHLPAYTPLATCAPCGILHGDTRSFRATTRNPGKPTRDYVNKSPACSLWTPHRVRVTRHVHSSLQREERTKKRRRCYRASSLGGWRRPRGLRNSLRSDSPRPHSSTGWPPPGPIKAGVSLLYTENVPDISQYDIQRYTGLSRHSALRRGIQELLQETT